MIVLESSDETNWQGWNEVDNVLAGIKFGRLREVAIVVKDHYRRDLDRTRQHLTAQFPSMYDKGILNIRQPIYPTYH